jgi:hypothetical protein
MKQKINVFCQNKGWLFQDLKENISRFGAISSEFSLPNMDSYICIRDSEGFLSPRPDKTLIQIHHINPVDLKGFGMVACVHPFQMRQFRQRDTKTPIFTLPIGAREIPVSPFPDKPVLGAFFREVHSKGQRNLKGSLLFKEAVEIARREFDFDVLLIGENLEHIASIGRYEKRGALPEDYARITALMTTSTSPMIPLSCYEALAAGRPVISTHREWFFDSQNVFLRDSAKNLAKAIINTLNAPTLIPQCPYKRDDWCKAMVKEAGNL